jgi:hypothetical protein
MSRLTVFLLAVASVLLAASAALAEVAVTRLDEKGRFCTIKLSGFISRADAARFRDLIETLRPGFEVLEVDLDSPGGDVVAALDIGQVVRREWLWTTVDDEDANIKCASACVYIFAAGVKRIASPKSRLIIHRPYFDPQLFGQLAASEARKKYDDLSRQVQAYLFEMGMSENLFAQMMRVPSNGSRRLQYQEMQDMNLVGEDPGYMEWLRARNVVKYGEPALKAYETWLKRQNEFSASCRRRSDPAEYLRCSKEFEQREPSPLRSTK